ncbi:hypothetical protein [Pseudotamlana carrageenivorans]|uniref:STAS/SEC14 domain-containing protein n=1 Tax=Pseudotamlana carrageenivorans TaxID=2069432 RepID=A0A2I7SLN8_9FLAO|nr:hypothetical protein [Tamlana carrageenivorans]AUS06802.1 hypothetical protein C1A40_15745 [Tamlana carrageenivorans]
MKFENSPLSKIHSFYKLELPFGNFYLCEKFIISEIHEGVHFDWNKIMLATKDIIGYYGGDAKVAYISNRVNSYSTDPQDWANVTENTTQITATAIVSYSSMSELNASLEKHFAKLDMETCNSLEEAITWVMNLKVTD